MTLQLNVNDPNTLMFATSAIGEFTINVAITKTSNVNSSSFVGTFLPMTEIFMPAGHHRVFIASYTPSDLGDYIFSYYGTNELGEVLQFIQRGQVSATGASGVGGGGVAIGVGL